MTTSETVRGLLAMSGKRQIDLAAHFGMSKQTMNNKLNKNSWSAIDLRKVAEFCGCKLAFIMPNGQQLYIEAEEKEKSPDDSSSGQ